MRCGCLGLTIVLGCGSGVPGFGLVGQVVSEVGYGVGCPRVFFVCHGSGIFRVQGVEPGLPKFWVARAPGSWGGEVEDAAEVFGHDDEVALLADLAERLVLELFEVHVGERLGEDPV